ncbi:glycerophosphoryl diester phosphodiesterase [Actinoalloteichus hoggarensis]|uniref:Putative glycerophosphoryl diester phosphodiesterase 1 n=1 Tax=Actinoalloteichus hoggarensis TaxID=1470176 RepID=A0A221VW74_9PSEU|nr:glycerophosphodiester phosphodiesterase family protein [Actinoalloteichus hoggarensis]ASO17763.1 putative glycerophosphoryl diester phosphodiesterase 1 [Actinoalloteichus hoggarensis]MBB5922890.1 glycerophosphoryl diester phosphodiesterase [Actinoalloteichus hoggarensis]
MSPAVVAHRGASADRAEHTLAAYTLALEQGADALECDVRLTRDRHLICIHDRSVDRTSSGRGLVSELTLAELSALDFGGGHPTGRSDPTAADGRLPVDRATGPLRFDDLLDLVVGASRPVRLFVETKHPVRFGGLVERALLHTLARHGLTRPASKEDSPVVMMSFSSRAVRRVREHAPALPTVLLLDRIGRSLHDGTLPPWADYTGPGIRLLRSDPDYVRRAEARGHPTYCWTVDEPADIELCRRLGVRFLATNRPAATRSVLGPAPSTTVPSA